MLRAAQREKERENECPSIPPQARPRSLTPIAYGIGQDFNRHTPVLHTTQALFLFFMAAASARVVHIGGAGTKWVPADETIFWGC